MVKLGTFLSLGLSGVILMLSISENSVAEISTITITGSIKNRTCSLASESKDLTVDLINSSVKQFHNKGATMSPVPFKIHLSPCGNAVTSVKVKFTGTADTKNNELLQIIGVNGIGLQFLSEQKDPIKINEYPSGMIKIQPGKDNSLNFYVRLMATGLPVTAGYINAQANFTMEFQ